MPTGHLPQLINRLGECGVPGLVLGNRASINRPAFSGERSR